MHATGSHEREDMNVLDVPIVILGRKMTLVITFSLALISAVVPFLMALMYRGDGKALEVILDIQAACAELAALLRIHMHRIGLQVVLLATLLRRRRFKRLGNAMLF